MNITKDDNLPDQQIVRQLSPRKNVTDETLENGDKNRLINVDKNEAYKSFIETDGMEESNKILVNMVASGYLERVQAAQEGDPRADQVGLGDQESDPGQEGALGQEAGEQEPGGRVLQGKLIFRKFNKALLMRRNMRSSLISKTTRRSINCSLSRSRNRRANWFIWSRSSQR